MKYTHIYIQTLPTSKKKTFKKKKKSNSLLLLHWEKNLIVLHYSPFYSFQSIPLTAYKMIPSSEQLFHYSIQIIILPSTLPVLPNIVSAVLGALWGGGEGRQEECYLFFDWLGFFEFSGVFLSKLLQHPLMNLSFTPLIFFPLVDR